MKRIDYQALTSALEEAAWTVEGLWTEELNPRAIAGTLTQLGGDLQRRQEEIERCGLLIDKVGKYCRANSIGKPGESYIEALIEDHKRLAALTEEY